jgi:tetratricopeptide (TPR) repeat protein
MKINIKEAQNIEELKKEVRELLQKADELQKSDMPKAISALNDAKNLLPQLKFEDDGKMSNNNVSYDKGTQEMLYLSKYGNILYEIKEYQDALVYYQKLQVKASGENRVYKAQGDCYRKLERYEESLKQYEIGLKVWTKSKSSSPSEKAELLNSRGLSYIRMNKNAEGLIDFNEAINLTAKKPNALYYCNKGAALYNQGNKVESLAVFKEAHELIKSGETAEGLNSENIKYINKVLEPFIEQIESLSKIELTKDDPVMKARENQFVNESTNSLSNPAAAQEILDEGKKLLSTKEQLKLIEADPDLYEYYDGFLFTMSQSYITSVTVKSGKIAIDSSNTAVDVATNLISLIPLVGEKIASGVGSAWKFYKDALVTDAATNICKFATTPTDFDALAQDVTVQLIGAREAQIPNIKPEKSILPKWAAKFAPLFKKYKDSKDEIMKKLYGERNETELQKFGAKIANDLIEKWIASGNIYEGKVAVRILPEDKKQKLFEAALKLFDQDLQTADEVYIPEKVESKTETSCCTVFSVYEEVYANKLLNSAKLLQSCIEAVGIQAVLNHGADLHQDLIDEALGNYELAVAGLLSLD